MRLSDCFIELMAYMAYFKRSIKTRQPSYERFKTDIQRLITQSEESFSRTEFPKEDYELARFAVFSWIDETVMGSEWTDKGRWLAETLQLRYFNTTDAGVEFFQKLKEMGPHQIEVREVYYLCLCLGFMGRYEQIHIEPMKFQNLKILTSSSMGLPSLETGDLFPEAYPPEGGEDEGFERSSRFSIGTVFFMGFPVFLYGILFLIYWFILTNIGKELIT